MPKGHIDWIARGAVIVEIVKTVLMGCGALALLSVVGCVGMVGVGSYAVNQAIDEQSLREALEEADNRHSTRPERARSTSDPFGEYQPNTYDEDGDQIGGWGEEAQ